MAETQVKLRVLKAVCNVCKKPVTLDIGEMTLKQARESLQNAIGFNCSAGNHVEVGRMYDFLDVDWMSLQAKVDDVPSDVDFGLGLVKKHGVDNVFYLGGEDTGKAVGVKCLREVNDLDHMGFGEFASTGYWYSRHDAPSGYRFYVRAAR